MFGEPARFNGFPCTRQGPSSDSRVRVRIFDEYALPLDPPTLGCCSVDYLRFPLCRLIVPAETELVQDVNLFLRDATAFLGATIQLVNGAVVETLFGGPHGELLPCAIRRHATMSVNGSKTPQCVRLLRPRGLLDAPDKPQCIELRNACLGLGSEWALLLDEFALPVDPHAETWIGQIAARDQTVAVCRLVFLEFIQICLPRPFRCRDGPHKTKRIELPKALGVELAFFVYAALCNNPASEDRIVLVAGRNQAMSVLGLVFFERVQTVLPTHPPYISAPIGL